MCRRTDALGDLEQCVDESIPVEHGTAADADLTCGGDQRSSGLASVSMRSRRGRPAKRSLRDRRHLLRGRRGGYDDFDGLGRLLAALSVSFVSVALAVSGLLGQRIGLGLDGKLALCLLGFGLATFIAVAFIAVAFGLLGDCERLLLASEQVGLAVCELLLLLDPRGLLGLDLLDLRDPAIQLCELVL